MTNAQAATYGDGRLAAPPDPAEVNQHALDRWVEWACRPTAANEVPA